MTASNKSVFMEFSRAARRLYGVRSSQTLLIRVSTAAANRSQIPLTPLATARIEDGSTSLRAARRSIPSRMSCARMAGKLRPIWSARALVNQFPTNGRSPSPRESRGSSSLDPGVARFYQRQFQVARIGKELYLCHGHARTERSKQQRPSPHPPPQNPLAQQASAQQEQKNINQQETAHGLKLGEALQGPGQADEERHGDKERLECRQNLQQVRHGPGAGAPARRSHRDEHDQRRENSEPLIPGPVGEQEVWMRFYHRTVGIGDRREQSQRKHREHGRRPGPGRFGQH